MGIVVFALIRSTQKLAHVQCKLPRAVASSGKTVLSHYLLPIFLFTSSSTGQKWRNWKKSEDKSLLSRVRDTVPLAVTSRSSQRTHSRALPLYPTCLITLTTLSIRYTPCHCFPSFLLPSFFYFSITKWQGKCRLSGRPLASMTQRKAARPWAGQPVNGVSAPVPVSFPVHQCAGEANDWIQSAAWLMRGPSDPGQAINHVIRTNVPRKKQNTPSAHGIHCIHLHLCMHAVKACQGHRDGEQSSSPLQITLQRQEMREVCVCMHLCVCWQAGVWVFFRKPAFRRHTVRWLFTPEAVPESEGYFNE